MTGLDRRALIVATAIGLVLQLAMIVAGHYVPFIRDKGFLVGGLALSLLAGLVYQTMTRGPWGAAVAGGATAGGVCALIGIAASVALGDTPAMVLAFGTVSSAVTGLIGGAIGKLAFAPTARS